VPNEEERQDDEQEHETAEEHDRAEGPTKIRVERDVAEAERAHHREGPVDPGEPGVILSLPRHDHVE
jgi:hypothetical protein